MRGEVPHLTPAYAQSRSVHGAPPVNATSGSRDRRRSRAPPAVVRLPRRARCEHVFVLIVCVLIPRFELAVAAGGREALAAGPGRAGARGRARAADRRGVRGRRGLRRARRAAAGGGARALPDAAARHARPRGGGRRVGAPARALEGIGAAVESGRPGLAWFDARGLRKLHGGTVEGVIAAARRALGTPARLGAAPSRFAALAAGLAAPASGVPRSRREAASPPTWPRCRSTCSPPRRDRRAAGDPRALRDPHARRARRAAARRPGRPLRRRRPAGEGPRARARTPRSGPAGPPRTSRSGSSCPSRPPASSSSARSAC